ncbi:MAG TPA: DUF1345 domain-containing protein [Burkholderiaceae bacterium]|nr:DUF1345 domain-containing protein [Burkholderiaceae bacterium]
MIFRDVQMVRRRQYVLAITRFVQGRPRLLTGLALGSCGAILLPQAIQPAARMLIAWNITVWSYLIMVGWLMFRATSTRVQAIAEREDPSATAVLVLMSITAMASLAAIVLELAATRELRVGERLIHYALTASTLLGSWLFVNTMFTFHYARMFYRSAQDRRPLRFPDAMAAAPDYWDFLYFSFTIAAAAQTSDVSVMTRSMRKAVLSQSVLGFLFNAAIIGLSINVAAGLIGS